MFILMGTHALFSKAEKIPNTPAGKRVSQVFDLINEGNRQKWEIYVKKNFSGKALEAAPMEEHLRFFSETCDTYDRLVFEYVYEKGAADDVLSIKLKSPSTDTWLKLKVKVEKESPHKIIDISLRLSWPPKGSVPSAKLSDREMAEILSRFLDKLAKAGKFSGAVLLAKEDKILFKGAYGLASERFKVANKIDTKLNLGSMNKMFTAVAVARLVEKGKLSYDDPVGKYLDSGWVQPQTAKTVKIKHLLSHTSGLGDFFTEAFLNSSRLLHRDIEDWKPLVNKDKPKFEPGSQWSYSNNGMVLLGPIIEKAGGQGYFDYIRENIYEPAGMINSDNYDMDRPVPNLAIGYEKKYTDEGFYWRNNIFDHAIKGGPAGGGYSTVEDMFRFSRALLAGKLVDKKSLELLTSVKPELNSTHYGYGFGIRKIMNKKTIGHSGGYIGINAVLQIFTESGYAYVIMSNRSNGIELVWLKLDTLLLPRD
jgi:CubicO group peptidase (beta-lactamase class C family)